LRIGMLLGYHPTVEINALRLRMQELEERIVRLEQSIPPSRKKP
jgi:hypothetical protein